MQALKSIFNMHVIELHITSSFATLLKTGGWSVSEYYRKITVKMHSSEKNCHFEASAVEAGDTIAKRLEHVGT